MVPKLGLFLRPSELLHLSLVSLTGRRTDERKPMSAFRKFQQVWFVFVFFQDVSHGGVCELVWAGCSSEPGI